MEFDLYNVTKKETDLERLQHVYYNLTHRQDVEVCREWKNSADTFMKFVLDNGYGYGSSIRRINQDGIFEPSNTKVTPPRHYKLKLRNWEGIAKKNKIRIL